MPDARPALNDLNPYLHGLYAPVDTEVTATDLPVIGEIPRDLFGGYFRNGPNPLHAPTGPHHWFDGDGMLHGVWFENGKAEYRNRYIRTDDHLAERAGTLDAGGVLLRANRTRAGAAYKDTANTDVVLHDGSLLALWYISGKPVRVDPRTLETIRTETFGGRLPRHASAHSKVDPETGEFLFFDYSLDEPWMSYGVVSPANELVHFTRIDLPGPRLPHDMGMTENHVILHDLPVVMTDQGLREGYWRIHMPEGQPARFGVLPRRGDGRDIRWFEAEHCYIYHVANCWEEGDEIVMHACRMVPNGLSPDPKLYGPYVPMIAVLALHAVPWEWRFNLRTGDTRSRQLDDGLAEFPAVNQDRMGRFTRHAYMATLDRADTLRFDGIAKYDLVSGAKQLHRYAPGVFGSEAAFAPRPGATAEDDGWLVTIVSDAASGTSEAQVFDAADIAPGPVARVRLPRRVPAGFHATWARGDLVRRR